MDIFVGSLPFKLKEKELREIFEKFGEVASVTIIIDKRTRQNKGYGFVQMPDEKKAIEAIQSLNGTEVMGRTIIVSRSEEGNEAPKRGSRKSGTTVKGKTTAQGGWKSKRFPKKKKINVIDKHSDDDKKAQRKKRGGVKLAKNFKVGKRRKR